MSGVMSRTLAILERLAGDVNGLPLATLADELDIPRSAAHRLLSELVELGWVRQSRDRGDYRLTTRLVSLGLTHLKLSGVPDLCQPIIDRLAVQSGELVRMGVVDEDHLTWVVTAQGATSGLRYDPDAGIDARLSCTSSGLAWLSTLTDDEALELVTREGWPKSGEFGVNAPTGPTAFLKLLRAARRQGHAITHETYRPGISSLGVPVSVRGKGTVGVVVISGPSVRLTDERLQTLVPAAHQAADELAQASRVSSWFDRAYRPRVASASMLAAPATPDP